MEFFFTKSLIFFGFNHFGTEFLCSGSALCRTEPNFQVQVQAKAKPNIRFRFRFGAKSAEPGPNWTVASLVVRIKLIRWMVHPNSSLNRCICHSCHICR